MAQMTECLISVELASALRRLVSELGLKMPTGRFAFRCKSCGRPVKPHVSADGKLAPHFEHLTKNMNCNDD